MPPRESEATRAIYVRIPLPEAEKLDRAAERLRASKRDVIATLLADHLDPDGEDVLVARPRRIVVDDDPRGMTLGHASFTPAPAADVLTLEEAAELLRVSPQALRARADAGDVPGRRLGDEWRFHRDALLAWLGGGAQRADRAVS